MISSADSLKYMQQLRELAESSVTAARAKAQKQAAEEEKDYKSIFAKIQKEQEEWDAKMKELDIAQYKIEAMDSFWSDRHKYNNLAYRYALREQQAQNQKSINSLVSDITSLQRLNLTGLANGDIDAESAVELNKSLNTALQSVVMLSLMNNSAMQSSMSKGFFF